MIALLIGLMLVALIVYHFAQMCQRLAAAGQTRQAQRRAQQQARRARRREENARYRAALAAGRAMEAQMKQRHTSA
jgi:hypothetical protein